MNVTERMKYADELISAVEDILHAGVKQFSVAFVQGEWTLSYPPTVDVGLDDETVPEE